MYESGIKSGGVLFLDVFLRVETEKMVPESWKSRKVPIIVISHETT